MFSSHKLNVPATLILILYVVSVIKESCYYIQERRIVKRLLYERSKLSYSIFIHIDEMLNGVSLYNSIILSFFFIFKPIYI